MRIEQISEANSPSIAFDEMTTLQPESLPSVVAPEGENSRNSGHAWKVDEHWTAVTAYLAEMYLPDEG